MSAGSDMPQQPQPGQQPPPYPQPPYQPFQPAPPPRRANPWKWIVIGCGSLVLLSVCAGVLATTGLIAALTGGSLSSSSDSGGGTVGTAAPVSANQPQLTAVLTPPSAGAPPAAKVGDTATTRNYTMTLHAMQNPVAATGPLPPPAGKKRVALDVTITNTSGQEVAYNPLYAKLRLADNTEANATFGGVEPALQSGKLANGEAARGWLTFEIPADAQPATFVYEIITFGSGGRITFNLR